MRVCMHPCASLSACIESEINATRRDKNRTLEPQLKFLIPIGVSNGKSGIIALTELRIPFQNDGRLIIKRLVGFCSLWSGMALRGAGATWKQHEPVWSYREECDQVTNEEPGGALKQRPIHINKFGIHKMNARLVACV